MSEEPEIGEESGRVEQATEEVEERVDEVLDSLNTNIDDLLAEVLETRSRAAVYVGLRKAGEASPEEVAEQTGLYPGKVENTIEELEDEGIVEETPSGYEAISPTELVRKVPERIGEAIEGLLQRDDETELDA